MAAATAVRYEAISVELDPPSVLLCAAQGEGEDALGWAQLAGQSQGWGLLRVPLYRQTLGAQLRAGFGGRGDRCAGWLGGHVTAAGGGEQGRRRETGRCTVQQQEGDRAALRRRVDCGSLFCGSEA